MRLLFLFIIIILVKPGFSQMRSFPVASLNYALNIPNVPNIKLFSRSYGVIIGIQRAEYTFLELGVEQHWRKIKLVKPRLFSLGINMEYNFKYNSLAYRAGFWMKRGRINLTYGGNIGYFTDFTDGRFGISPAIGFRLLGFHLLTGYNFILNRPDEYRFNTFTIALRYFFPTSNKIRIKRKHKKDIKI